MGQVIAFTGKKKLEKKKVSRGSRGKILLKVGQTWCRIHNGEEVVIHKLGEKDNKGKQRVWYSRKFSHHYWDDVAEMTFRMNFMQKEAYRTFSNATWQKWRSQAVEHGAGDALYRLFDQPTPSEEMMEVSVRKRQPVPKRGELWKSNYSGESGPRIRRIKEVSRSSFGGLVITFIMRGGWGVSPCDDFRKEHTRIGWLGEVPELS